MLMLEKNGKVVNIKDSKELWSEYILDDDTIIRVKYVVTEIRLLDEKNEDGSPKYNLSIQPVISTLKK